MDGLCENRRTGTIGNVLDFVFEHKLLPKPSNISKFEHRIGQESMDERGELDKTFFDELREVKYHEIIALNNFIESNTPFSTKHGVKGAEFENVLVVIDDSAWNQYNFNALFSGNKSKLQFNRTRNLFYVCCSRAKNKLGLLVLSRIDDAGLNGIENWLGADKIYDVSKL
jgi:DNA helicase II / ATP-dependent DNA helicase PcrA